MKQQPIVAGRSNCSCRERGVATIELAISIPLLLLLMLSTAEIGRLLFQYNTLAKAVRDGARFAASNASVNNTRLVNLSAQDLTRTINLVVNGNTAGTGAALLPGLVPGNVQVTENDATGFVSVTATYTYVPMMGATLPTFGLSAQPISFAMNLPATVVMRAL